MMSMNSCSYILKTYGPSTKRYTMVNYMHISIQMLLCLVLLSSHACNARPFGTAQVISCKKNEDCLTNESVFPAAQPFTSKELAEAEENRKQILKTTSSNLEEKNKEKQLELSVDYDPPKTHPPPPPPPLHNYHVEAESHVSVSYRVPRNKIGEKQPQFNLDYEPPRTHPPVHN